MGLRPETKKGHSSKGDMVGGSMTNFEDPNLLLSILRKRPKYSDLKALHALAPACPISFQLYSTSDTSTVLQMPNPSPKPVCGNSHKDKKRISHVGHLGSHHARYMHISHCNHIPCEVEAGVAPISQERKLRLDVDKQ